MATLKDLLNNGDRFAAENGMMLTEVREGYAQAEVRVQPHHLNAAGVCQGGVYFTLADLCFAAVTNSHGQLALGVQNSITYLQSAREGDTLVAKAQETFNHKKLPFCTVNIYNQDDDLLCVVTGTAYKKRETMPYDGLQ